MDIWLYMLSLARPLSEEEARAMLARLPEALREHLAGRKGAKRDASLCAYALLRRALHDRYGWEELPEVAFTARGKPYFPSCPDVFFSLSHTRGAVLLALHEQSVGADIERLRPVSERMRARFHAADEAAFWQNWVRRESRCKRRGISAVALRGREVPAVPNERVFSLAPVGGYAAAVCTASSDRPDKLIRLTVEELI